ncbi:MAG: hypothetical protein IKD89_00420 [Clostridia bacterium]|nr:hypothetical protein [Clostridia bacterium]
MKNPPKEPLPADLCPATRKTPRVLQSEEHDLSSRTSGMKKDFKNS